MRLLDGAPAAMQRERPYWPHLAWVAIKFLNHFQFWWVFWRARDAEWNFVFFVAQLTVPLLLYLQASALVTSAPGAIQNWRVHFYSIRRRFFGLNIAFIMAVAIVPALAINRLAPLPVLGLAMTALVLSIIALRSDSHRTQATVVALTVLLQLAAISTVIMQPERFAA